MNLIKIVMYIVDFDNIGVNDIKNIIDNNRHINLFKFASGVRDIGEWHDEHILNYNDTPIEEFEKYFKNEIKKEEVIMSEKKKLDEEYECKLKELQNNCSHENTEPYSNHQYDSDYCLKCGAIINIKMK